MAIIATASEVEAEEDEEEHNSDSRISDDFSTTNCADSLKHKHYDVSFK